MNAMTNTPATQPAKPKHYEMTREVMKTIIDYMPTVQLDPEQVRKWQMLTIDQQTILLASINIDVPNPQAYEKATHQISTAVRYRWPWMKVAYVNGTGYRYAVRISREQPLPVKVPFPGVSTETLLIGVQRNGQRAQLSWEKLDTHILIAGMTRSGKSSFVRLLAYQALAASCQVWIADMKERTFLALEERLSRPIALSPEAADELVDQVQGEIEHRKTLFNQLPGFHEKLSEYNQAAIKAGTAVMPRLIVILDEYLDAIHRLGGPRGKFAQKIWNIVRIGLAYGVHIILTAQDIGKDDLGGLRDQFGLVIAFRTRNADTARILGVRPAATIPDGLPGRAYCNELGWVQTYKMEKTDLVQTTIEEGMTADERKLFDAAQAGNWRVTRSLIVTTLGVKEREARRLQDTLAKRGWLIKDLFEDNAFMVSNRWKDVAGHGWTGLDGAGPVGGWTGSMPKTGEEEA